MSNIKKVVLVLVEGISDRSALEGFLVESSNTNKIHFQIVGCDITSNYNSSPNNIIKQVDNQIKKFIKKTTGVKKSDIIDIIHIIDIDGCFIIPENIVEDQSYMNFHYIANKIYSKNKLNVIERNERKKANISRLISCGTISRINYKIYYFSCNIDHVLHNDANILDDEKEEMASEFADKYEDNVDKFIQFLSDNQLCPNTDYLKSWEYIKNSKEIIRCSNINIVFDYLNHYND